MQPRRVLVVLSALAIAVACAESPPGDDLETTSASSVPAETDGSDSSDADASTSTGPTTTGSARALADPSTDPTTSTTGSVSDTSDTTVSDTGAGDDAASTSQAPATTSGGSGTTGRPPTTTTAASTTSRRPTTTTTTRRTTTTTTTTTTTAAPAAKPERIDLPAQINALEGVATDTGTGRVFVGDLNNGNVWVGRVDGEPYTLFSSGAAVGRANALGLATDQSRRRLFIVAPQGRVDIANLDTGAHIASVAMPGARSPNDATVAPDGTVYVTDLGRPVVYRIAPGSTSAEVWVDYAGTGAVDTTSVSQHGNGIVADANHVLVAYMVRGELLRFDRSNGSVSRVAISGASTAGRDGLVLCGNRLYGVDNASLGGQDRIWITRLSGDRTSGSSAGTIGSSSFSVPSTAAAIDGSLVVANAQFGVSPRRTPYWLSVVDASCPR